MKAKRSVPTVCRSWFESRSHELYLCSVTNMKESHITAVLMLKGTLLVWYFMIIHRVVSTLICIFLDFATWQMAKQEHLS